MNNFEKLKIWQKSVDFVEKVLVTLENKELQHFKYQRIVSQLISCSCSISQNIAEGSGRSSKKEFRHFLYISRGSLFEAITLITIMDRNNLIKRSECCQLKEITTELSKMLYGLIKRTSAEIDTP